MQRAELRQYKGQGDRQEPVRDGGTLRLISLIKSLITLSTSSNYTNTTEPEPSKITQKLHKQTSVKLRLWRATFTTFTNPLQPFQT